MTTDTVPARPWCRRDEVALAVVFLTRVPLRIDAAFPPDAHSRAMAWFALVGAGIGLAGGGVYALAWWLGLPVAAAALLALAATAWLTGALHEDGLADVADGLGGGRTRARKLEIMKDSRVGTYGLVAVVFSVGLRASALAALADPMTVAAALAAAAGFSRGLVPGLARVMPSARPDGVAGRQGRPSALRAAAALVSGLALAVLMLGPAAGVGMIAAAAGAGVVAWLAMRQIGGYTGDVLGTAQQVAETLLLLALTATLR